MPTNFGGGLLSLDLEEDPLLVVVLVGGADNLFGLRAIVVVCTGMFVS